MSDPSSKRIVERAHVGVADAVGNLGDAETSVFQQVQCECLLTSFEVAASFWLDQDRTIDAFRSGNGFAWHEHNGRLFCGTEMFLRTGYRTNLVSAWLPALDGVIERLRSGARVADIG